MSASWRRGEAIRQGLQGAAVQIPLASERRMKRMAVPDWLLDSDPAIRWQVLRDLVHTPAEVDVLRALDYFRSVDDTPDPRLREAIEVLRSKQQLDGTWPLENTHPGTIHFALEDHDGRPSRWNTLRALRVLRWCERSAT